MSACSQSVAQELARLGNRSSWGPIGRGSASYACCCQHHPDPHLAHPQVRGEGERGEGWTVRAVLPAQHGGGTASYRPFDLPDRLIPSTRDGVFVADEPRSIVLTCRLCSARASIRFQRLIEGAIVAVAECRVAGYV